MDSPPAQDPPVLDAAVMAAIRSLGAPGEPDVYAQIAQLFLSDVPVHLSALRTAIADNSAESVRQIAHRLRGGTLEMGALRMAPLCAALERDAHAGSLGDASGFADTLDREFAAVRAALEKEL